MTNRLLYIVFGFTLLLASCSSGPETSSSTAPKDLIIGKWQPIDKGQADNTYQFLRDGKLKVGGGFPSETSYKFTADDTVEYEIERFSWQYTRWKVAVTKDELVGTVVESKSRPGKSADWTVSADDRARTGTKEQYRRLP